MERRAACSSMKEPVPAAQTLFIWKSTTRPSRTLTYLESWPPISKTVSTCGSAATAPRAWQVISSRTMSAPTNSPIIARPEPVVAAAATRTVPPRRASRLARPSCTAALGLPRVRRYCASSRRPSRSTSTRFVLVEPTSMPRVQGVTPASSRGHALRGRHSKPRPRSSGSAGRGSRNVRRSAAAAGAAHAAGSLGVPSATHAPVSPHAPSEPPTHTASDAPAPPCPPETCGVHASPAPAPGSAARSSASVSARPAASSEAPWAASAASRAQPTAPKNSKLSLTSSSPSPRPNTSRAARTTPAFSSTPPPRATGVRTGSDRTMVAL